MELPEASAVLRLVSTTDFARGCYVAPGQDDELGPLGVAFMPFSWEAGAPKLWLFTSLGLSAVAQSAVRPSGYRTPSNIELCFALHVPDSKMWKEFEQAWQGGTLGQLNDVPAVLTRFHEISLDVLSLMTADKASFSFGDCIKNVAISQQLPSMLIVPPVPEFAQCGVTPFRIEPSGKLVRPDITAAQWTDVEVLQASATHLFLQCAPITSAEFEVAVRQQGFDFFLHGLLPTDTEADRGFDSSAIIANLDRESRLAVFEAQK